MRLGPKPQFRYYGFPKSYLEIARGLLAGNLMQGASHIEALEERLAEITGAEFCLCMPRGRLGLYYAVRHLIKPGQNVILSPYTIFDVVNMVVSAGGLPVFADIDPTTCNIDPEQVRDLIDSDTGAVIATHLQGLTCDIEEIAALCIEQGVPLIEDGAQCLGGRVGGRHVGTFGDAGIFSFSLKKNVNTFSGGFLITSNRHLYERTREELVTFPLEDKQVVLQQAAKCLVGNLVTSTPVYQIVTSRVLRYKSMRDGQLWPMFTQPEVNPQLRTELPAGYKRRMTPLQARLALPQIDTIDDDIRARVRYATRYHEGLMDLPGIDLPPLREDGSHTYLSFAVQVSDRSDFVKHVVHRGYDVRAQSLTNTADLPCFARYARDCPQARRTAERAVLLPIYPGYGSSELERGIEITRQYFGARS